MNSLRTTLLISIVFSSLATAAIMGCAAGNQNPVPGAGGSSGNGSTSAQGGEGGQGGQGGQGGDIGFGGSGAPTEGEIYVNSLDKLYRFEPIGKVLTEIGVFDCVVADPSGTADGGMHDIAVDKKGALYGVAKLGPQDPNSISSAHVIVSINKTNGKCEKVFAVPNDLIDPSGGLEIRGLSFVPQGTIQPDQETLVALEIYGRYISIDLPAQKATAIGNLNGNGPNQWTTKGADIVSIILDKTYVTAKLGSPTDNLAAMDPKTGAIVTNIGETPITTIGGLAYWGGTLYGFTGDGDVYAIDPKTGATTGIAIAGAPPGIQYHGAGVTTDAPIEPPK
jgi:PQQ-like domain